MSGSSHYIECVTPIGSHRPPPAYSHTSQKVSQPLAMLRNSQLAKLAKKFQNLGVLVYFLFCYLSLVSLLSPVATQWCGKNLEAGAAKLSTGTNGNLTIMPSYTTRLSWISSSSLLFPSISSSSSSSFFFSSPSSSFSPYFRRIGRPPGPPSSPAGTSRTGTGVS